MLLVHDGNLCEMLIIAMYGAGGHMFFAVSFCACSFEMLLFKFPEIDHSLEMAS